MALGDAGNQGMGPGEPGAEALLERLDSLLRRIQELRRKCAAAIDYDTPLLSGDSDAAPEAPRRVENGNEEPHALLPSFSSAGSAPPSGEWKRRYTRAMEAVHAPGSGRPSRVRDRTDPIVPGSPGFRREDD